MGQYRDERRNVFLDGNSNLVIRATKEGGKYFSGKLSTQLVGGIGHTWEARVKFDCLTAGCRPAWWLSNDHPVFGGEVDWSNGMATGSGLREQQSTQDRTARRRDVPVPCGQRVAHMACHMDEAGMYFWRDYVDGAPPYFEVPAHSVDDWPFNFPDYQMFPVLILAVSGSVAAIPARVPIRRTCSSTGYVSGRTWRTTSNDSCGEGLAAALEPDLPPYEAEVDHADGGEHGHIEVPRASRVLPV
jgi:hypothetical protein